MGTQIELWVPVFELRKQVVYDLVEVPFYEGWDIREVRTYPVSSRHMPYSYKPSLMRLHGKKAKSTLEMLNRARKSITSLEKHNIVSGGDRNPPGLHKETYWVASRLSACRMMRVLAQWAELYPEGIWTIGLVEKGMDIYDIVGNRPSKRTMKKWNSIKRSRMYDPRPDFYGAFYPQTYEVLETFQTLEEGLEFVQKVPAYLCSLKEAYRASNEKTLPRSYFNEEGSLVLGGSISTTQYMDWRTVALLKGLGFEHFRLEEGDEFFQPNSIVERIYYGWTPSKDGSRYYMAAYRFTGPQGHDNVVVFSSNPSGFAEQLFALVAVSSYADFERFQESGTYESWERYMGGNEVLLP